MKGLLAKTRARQSEPHKVVWICRPPLLEWPVLICLIKSRNLYYRCYWISRQPIMMHRLVRINTNFGMEDYQLTRNDWSQRSGILAEFARPQGSLKVGHFINGKWIEYAASHRSDTFPMRVSNSIHLWCPSVRLNRIFCTIRIAGTLKWPFRCTEEWSQNKMYPAYSARFFTYSFGSRYPCIP